MLRTCIASFILIAGCGPVSVTDSLPVTGSKCLSLSEPGATGLTVMTPSRVSWLFRVDTCRGDAVNGLTATEFEIYEDGKKVSAFESQQRIAPKGERFRLYSVVLLDLSGSLLRSGDFPALQRASIEYLDAVGVNDGHVVQVMTFDGRAEPQVLVPFTSNLATLKAGISSLSAAECGVSSDCFAYADRRTCAGWRCVDDSTNLNGAVVKSLAVLDAAVSQSGVSWRDGALVLFTDGTDQAARVSAAEALEAVRKSAQHVFSVGLGGEIDADALRAMGKDGTWPVAKAEELSAAFTEIAKRVSSLANRFYVLEYCSPKRSGKHELKVLATAETERDGRLSGQLSSEFDATGFTSGCSL